MTTTSERPCLEPEVHLIIQEQWSRCDHHLFYYLPAIGFANLSDRGWFSFGEGEL
jgi:hypothetical protein